MRLSYYPGCSLKGTSGDYDISCRTLCQALDIELIEIPDWNCCGASSAHMLNHEAGIRLPMRNLLKNLAEKRDILVPCAACFQRLRAADLELRHRPRYWDIDTYDPSFTIIHISSFLASPAILEKIRKLITMRFDHLRIACYYGCLSLRHPKITGAQAFEQPETLESLALALGARPVSWSHRTECCSGSLTMTRTDIATKLVGDIQAAATRAGANCFLTDCPMCQANLEGRQRNDGPGEPLPAFFATELLLAAITGCYPAAQKKTHLIAADIISSSTGGKAT